MVSEKFSTFNNYLLIMVAYVALNAVRLRIPIGQMADINDMNGDWTPLWAIYASPVTQTAGSITDLNTEYDTAHTYVNKLKMQLKHDMNVVLSGADRVAIGIPEDAGRREEIPAYGFAPSGSIVHQGHLIATVDVSSTEAGHENDGKRPVDVGRIGMKMLVVAADAPIPAANTFLPHPASGTVTMDFSFTADQVGKIAYVIFWYENPKGDNRSPESIMILINII